MKRLTTDSPKGYTEWLLNLAFVKDNEVMLRGLGEDNCDISLVDYSKISCLERCNIDKSEVPTEEFAEHMDCDCLVAVMYFLAVGAAELRERLKEYEDTGLDYKGKIL